MGQVLFGGQLLSVRNHSRKSLSLNEARMAYHWNSERAAFKNIVKLIEKAQKSDQEQIYIVFKALNSVH